MHQNTLILYRYNTYINKNMHIKENRNSCEPCFCKGSTYTKRPMHGCMTSCLFQISLTKGKPIYNNHNRKINFHLCFHLSPLRYWSAWLTLATSPKNLLITQECAIQEFLEHQRSCYQPQTVVLRHCNLIKLNTSNT